MNYAGHHVISATTPVVTSSPLAIGFLWTDTSGGTPALKVCSSISPVTFVSVGGGAVADSDVTFTDITTGNVSSTKHGYAPKSPGDATKFLNGATTPDYAAVKDSDLATTDVTTNDASSSKHGFLPKLPFTLDAGTIAANAPFQFKQTTNNGAVTFYNFVIDCTYTSAGQAYLQAWRKAGVEQASLRQDGLFACQSIALATNITVPGEVAIGNGGACRISDGSDYSYLKRISGATGGFKVQDSGTNYRSLEHLYARIGSGSPEGAVTAPVGATFHRTDGGAVTSFYVKESGTGNTGWVAK